MREKHEGKLNNKTNGKIVINLSNKTRTAVEKKLLTEGPNFAFTPTNSLVSDINSVEAEIHNRGGSELKKFRRYERKWTI